MLWRFGAVVLCALLAWIAFMSPVLSVRRVRLLGAKHTRSADVIEAAGLDRSDNLLLVSTADVERAAETLPWVRRAEARRVLPGTLRVKVFERKPVMALTLKTGSRRSRWLLDGDGRILARGRGGKKLPVLAGIALEGIEPGSIIASKGARAGLRAYASMRPRLRHEVVAVFAPTEERLTFTLRNRTLVRFGAAENLDAKNSVLRSVLAKLRAQGKRVAYIDVRVPASPAISESAPPDVASSPPPGA